MTEQEKVLRQFASLFGFGNETEIGIRSIGRRLSFLSGDSVILITKRGMVQAICIPASKAGKLRTMLRGGGQPED